MLAQAAGLAVLAAISPTALLVVTVYLGSARPRLIALSYLAGAVLMSMVVGVVVLIALRSGHLQLNRNRTPRYGLRTGLGLLVLAVAAVIARRRPVHQPGPPATGSRIMSRLIANPAPPTALVAGLVVFTPSVTFVAAVQVVATARASVPLTVAGLALVIVIGVACVWLPLAAFLAVPGPTSRWLASFNGWLRAHGRLLALAALVAAGVFLVINGVAGLAG